MYPHTGEVTCAHIRLLSQAARIAVFQRNQRPQVSDTLFPGWIDRETNETINQTLLTRSFLPSMVGFLFVGLFSSRLLAYLLLSPFQHIRKDARTATWNFPSTTSGKTSSWRCAASRHRWLSYHLLHTNVNSVINGTYSIYIYRRSYALP